MMTDGQEVPDAAIRMIVPDGYEKIGVASAWAVKTVRKNASFPPWRDC